MIEKWLVARREAALEEWDRLARLAVAGPVRRFVSEIEQAQWRVRGARRRLRLWDLLLDAWTLNGRR